MMHIKQNVSLKPFTTFRVGGMADAFCEATCAIELAEAFEYADKLHLPVFVLGGGSNILFSDKGFRGLIVRMVDGGLRVSGEKIVAGAGVPLVEVVGAAREASLAGIELLSGIPGTFGGAIRGNAGAFGADIGASVASVKAFHCDTGMVREYRREECEFSYRTSLFKRHPKIIVLSGELRLTPGDVRTLERIGKETIARREAKHPQDALCAGSFFMNPVVQDKRLREEFEKDTGTPPKDDKLPAGWIVDYCGLRGKTVGGAKISDLHPNYLVNTGEATAEDVVMLSSLVKQRVRSEVGIQLKEEVQMVGF